MNGAGRHAGGMAGLSARAMAAYIPLQAQIEITGRCHLDCVHCYLDVKHPPRGELTTSEIVRVLDELAAAGAVFLTITGGEVFLRPDALDIIRAAKQRSFAVRVFTSGTLLTRAMIDELARIGPMAVEISIYGLHAHVHDTVTRRRGSLRKSLRAAVLLRRAGVPVVIKSPILAGTGDAHFDLVDAARRIGAGYTIDPSLISRRDGGTEPLSSRPSIASMARLYADPRIAPIPDALPPRPPADQAPCAIARRVVRIGPQGDVYPCAVFPIAAGNVRERSFADIWRHSPLLAWIRGVSAGDLHGECGDCTRLGYCGRCSALALLEHGDFLGPTVDACDRAEARELGTGLGTPAGARRIADPTPLGKRPLGSFVPLAALRRAG